MPCILQTKFQPAKLFNLESPRCQQDSHQKFSQFIAASEETASIPAGLRVSFQTAHGSLIPLMLNVVSIYFEGHESPKKTDR